MLQLLHLLSRLLAQKKCWQFLQYHYFQLQMSDNLLNSISKASQETKNNISEFLKNLLKPQQNQTVNNEQKVVAQIFNRNTQDISLTKARELSKDQRTQRLLANHQFNYGEISFNTVYKIFQKIRMLRGLKQKQIFYDLGSGTGKVVFAAALCYPFIKCIGIEILESLHKFSKDLQQKVQNQQQNIQEQMKNSRQQQFKFPQIQFLKGDFKKTEWKDGTIIFASSTCYSKQVMLEIQNLCSKLDKGTIIVTLTRKLENVNGIALRLTFQGLTSWGNSTIYVHMKQY